MCAASSKRVRARLTTTSRGISASASCRTTRARRPWTCCGIRRPRNRAGARAMTKPTEVLLQTTIEPTANDWHIGRFSMLRDYLASLTAADGSRLFRVTARDRDPVGAPDSVLSSLDRSTYDQLWL